jgi:hypothetical protein
VAVFASVHLLALLTLFYTLGTIFTLVGYSRSLDYVQSRRDYILAYIVVYCIVFVSLPPAPFVEPFEQALVLRYHDNRSTHFEGY